VDSAAELRYTDDTAMAIGMAQSILAAGDIDPQHLGETFRKNFRKEPRRGYASGPPTIFSMVERMGMTYLEAAMMLFNGMGSLGNGAAMRVAPAGLYFHDHPELYDKAALSAAVTHGHPVGMDGGAVQATAVALAVGLDPEAGFSSHEFIATLIDTARLPEIREKMELVRDLIERRAAPDEAADAIGRTVAIHESMPFAVYAFLTHPGSFEDCLLCAALNGGDRDTLGAMACAISGAFLGTDQIPAHWVEKLENRRHIEGLASRLAEKPDRVC
jgi:poly(ADP-ribose) glycohydrolase ARH3